MMAHPHIAIIGAAGWAGSQVPRTLQPADRDPVNGRVSITDQIFPKLSSDKIKRFSRGGRAQLAGLTIRKLNSAWR